MIQACTMQDNDEDDVPALDFTPELDPDRRAKLAFMTIFAVWTCTLWPAMIVGWSLGALLSPLVVP